MATDSELELVVVVDPRPSLERSLRLSQYRVRMSSLLLSTSCPLVLIPGGFPRVGRLGMSGSTMRASTTVDVRGRLTSIGNIVSPCAVFGLLPRLTKYYNTNTHVTHTTRGPNIGPRENFGYLGRLKG